MTSKLLHKIRDRWGSNNARPAAPSWEAFLQRILDSGDIPRGLIVKDLENTKDRSFREYRIGDSVQIMRSPYNKPLRKGVGMVSEVFPTYVYVINVRTRWKYHHGRKVFTPDQLRLLGPDVNE